MAISDMSPTATDLLAVLSKEVTGIQLLWEVVNGLYFAPRSKALIGLEHDLPTVFPFMQSAMMESLLMRVSRLMDPAASGRGDGEKKNLSLKRLVDLEPRVAEDEAALRKIWGQASLKHLRDKYLSHNDLERSLTQDHTLTIPMEPTDIEALRALGQGLREFRRSINHKLGGAAFLDESLDMGIERELGVLGRYLAAGQLLFDLLPDHEAVQRAWLEVEHE